MFQNQPQYQGENLSWGAALDLAIKSNGLVGFALAHQADDDSPNRHLGAHKPCWSTSGQPIRSKHAASTSTSANPPFFAVQLATMMQQCHTQNYMLNEASTPVTQISFVYTADGKTFSEQSITKKKLDNGQGNQDRQRCHLCEVCGKKVNHLK